MKELSVEQKARRYDEVVAMAKECITYIPDEEVNKYMLDMFPELKESEGERTRKELINFVKSHLAGFPQCEKYIAWIEKQDDKPQDKSALEAINEEEVDNANKVEPKFKIGDWIVYNRIDHSREVMQIYDIRDNRYYFNDNTHFSWSVKECDEKSHLWTIEDVKDGDVLATKDSVFIFKHLDKNGLSLCKSYCEVLGNSGLGLGFDFSIYGVHPATKEQRDLLFAKIHKAGYEWNAETKELKKIEQTIEIPFGAKDSELQEATYHIPDGCHAEINGNEVVIKKGKQKTTWKPTEEQIEALEHLVANVKRSAYSFFFEDKAELLYSLLEQLKKLTFCSSKNFR